MNSMQHVCLTSSWVIKSESVHPFNLLARIHMLSIHDVTQITLKLQKTSTLCPFIEECKGPVTKYHTGECIQTFPYARLTYLGIE